MIQHVPFITRNALRNRRRSLLTIASIAVSLCLLGTLLTVYWGLFYGEPPNDAAARRLVTRHKVSLTQAVPVSYKQRIVQKKGVAAATFSQWFGGKYRDEKPQDMFARFVVEPGDFLKVNPDLTIPPEQQEAFLKTPNGCIISKPLMDKMKWKVGERIPIVGDIFPVTLELVLVGTFDDDGKFNRMYIPWNYVQELLPRGRRDTVGTIQILAESTDAVPGVIKAVDDDFANSPAPTKTETEQNFFLGFLAMMGPIKLFLAAISGAITFTLLLVSANTVAMTIRDRTREIAILRTLGYAPGTIVGLILGESAVLSFVGALIGGLLAAGMAAVLSKAPVPFPFPPMEPRMIVVVIVVGVAVGVLSAVIPATLASRKGIVESIRFVG
jgi:putative ABC transport system permease protein